MQTIAPPPVETAARRRLAEVVPRLPVRRRTLLAAAAALLLMAVGAGSVRTLMRNRPIGRLEFASAPVRVHQASGSDRHEGVGQWACRRAASLQTPPGSMGIFSLGDNVRGALAGSTRVEMAGRDRIQLEHGAVWVRVLPKGRGFAVESPHGTVRVTGTSFGVAATATETRVDVAEGTVEVTRNGRRLRVTGGQWLRIGPERTAAPEARSEGDRLPEWVTALLAKEKAAHAGQYVPSLNDE